MQKTTVHLWRHALWCGAVTCGLLAMVSHAQALPPVPSQATVSCDAVVANKCYVRGDFTLSTSSPGAHHFRLCRSHNTLGWGGCDVTMSSNTGTTFQVTGSHRPDHGFRRAYYYSACDASNQCTDYAANPEAYVETDTQGPTAPGNFIANCVSQTAGAIGCWTSGNLTLQVAPSTDGGSGVDTDAYKYCRSHDTTGGFAGCEVDMTTAGTTSFVVSGNNLPMDGKRRAYYVRAKDNVGNFGPWNNVLYVRVDRHDPAVSATPPPAQPQTSIQVLVTATDTAGGAIANSGVQSVRYRWNNPLNASCTNGTPTADGASLQAPSGNNTLYLCAKDFTGRTASWSAGPYQVAGQGASYSFQVGSVAPYVFACGNFCGQCNEGLGYAYDSNVIERNGKMEVFVHGAAGLCALPEQFHDTVVEGSWMDMKGGGVVTTRLGDVSAHLGSGCPLRDNNAAGGPDVVLNGSRPNPDKDRLVFYTRGNADVFRGKVALAYEEQGGGWILEDDNLLYPLCFDPVAANSDPCTKMGVARVAALDQGAHYYLYLEMFISANEVDLPPGVNNFGLRVGTLLMRIEKTSTPPYVKLETDGAQLFNPQTNGWEELTFHDAAPRGYVLEVCDGPKITTQNFANWRITGAEAMGDVSRTHTGEYLMTYQSIGTTNHKLVRYYRSFDPTFQSGVVHGSIDLSSVPNINTALLANLHRRQNGEYLLFFSDLPSFQNGNLNFGNSQIKSVELDLVFD